MWPSKLMLADNTPSSVFFPLVSSYNLYCLRTPRDSDEKKAAKIRLRNTLFVKKEKKKMLRYLHILTYQLYYINITY